ncbi:helix-turn-helix transcriptional regulator [Variovorax sp. DXTD-1]|uniref:helix-turn-helix transcriptional regulator n=1 Tax=Variovorax sp. DXTD-1 TaxID=2495592 RepID=UPI000F88FCFB|nr:LuxR C-terminal-related transcriptional regulator [Variovorax sp. DXTD-1]RST48607.1 helix-turn-helix transcriptional regulator [Variovorax sp. DXTD-1]
MQREGLQIHVPEPGLHEPLEPTVFGGRPMSAATAAAEVVRHLFAQANATDLAFLMRSIELGDSLSASQIARRILDGIAAHPEAKLSAVDAQRADKMLHTERIASKGPLTPRELNVLRLIAQGKTNRQIAEESKRSAHTIGAQLKSIYSKLAVKTRTQAVCEATQKGLLSWNASS